MAQSQRPRLAEEQDRRQCGPVIDSILDWFGTAISTYVLHVEHNNGYQWWSGMGANFALIGIFYHVARSRNCYEYRCLRVGTHKSQLDQHVRCRKHHNQHKDDNPHYRDAKDANS